MQIYFIAGVLNLLRPSVAFRARSVELSHEAFACYELGTSSVNQSYWQSVSRSHSHPIAKKILRCPRHIVVPSFDPLRNLKDSARALVACVLVYLSSIFPPSPFCQSSYRFALVCRVIQCPNRIYQKRGGMYFSLCRRVCAAYYQQQHHVMGVEYTMIAI